jgi:hypothetical protein
LRDGNLEIKMNDIKYGKRKLRKKIRGNANIRKIAN